MQFLYKNLPLQFLPQLLSVFSLWPLCQFENIETSELASYIARLVVLMFVSEVLL